MARQGVPQGRSISRERAQAIFRSVRVSLLQCFIVQLLSDHHILKIILRQLFVRRCIVCSMDFVACNVSDIKLVMLFYNRCSVAPLNFRKVLSRNGNGIFPVAWIFLFMFVLLPLS